MVGGGKQMPGGEAIADRNESHAGGGESRRHEMHPFLVAVGPSTAMDEGEHPAVRRGRRKDRHALIGTLTVASFDKRPGARPKAHDLVMIGFGDFREWFLRRIACDTHQSCPPLSASTARMPSRTRSDVSGRWEWREPAGVLDSVLVTGRNRVMAISSGALAPH